MRVMDVMEPSDTDRTDAEGNTEEDWRIYEVLCKDTAVCLCTFIRIIFVKELKCGIITKSFTFSYFLFFMYIFYDYIFYY